MSKNKGLPPIFQASPPKPVTEISEALNKRVPHRFDEGHVSDKLPVIQQGAGLHHPACAGLSPNILALSLWSGG
jgi:hypothetical protein